MAPPDPTQQEPDSKPQLRVVIADDSYLVREALAQIVARAPGLRIVGTCADRDSLLSTVTEVCPDVVMVDIRMPPTKTDEGIQVAQTLRRTHPRVGVVVLSQYAEPGYALALLEAGSAGRAYLLKEQVQRPRELVNAIEAVAGGGSVIDPAVVDLLVESQAHAPPDGAEPARRLSDLTPREHEVLAQLAQGKSNAAIADTLVLSKRAVEKHINSIFLKLDLTHEHDVSQRVKAALMFLAGESAARPAKSADAPAPEHQG